MKRDRIITVAAIAHGILFLLTGILVIVGIGIDPIFDATSEQDTVRAMGGIPIVIAAGLLWSVLRGVIDAPMRLVVAAISGLYACMVFIGPLGDAGTLAMIIAGSHLLFAIGWIGILLTADSPYRPRSVASAKREHQRTNG